MTSDRTPQLPSPGRTVQRLFLAAAALLFAAGLAAAFFPIPAEWAIALRWAGFGLFVPFALRRRSLLVWTFFAMLAGAELGVDAPQFASQTHFLADIFLRLIRMIVAPLIFGGIVTGIAGHNQLGGVGRVAIKALIFFEVATTLGMILGAVAINLSQAGVGITLPAAIQTAVPATHQVNWQEILLNVFPENIRPWPRTRFSKSPSSRFCSARPSPPCPHRSALRC
jgi:proton glutamate symport protein